MGRSFLCSVVGVGRRYANEGDITAAYLNTPMNDDVKHKWLILNKNVAKVLMSMDSNY